MNSTALNPQTLCLGLLSDAAFQLLRFRVWRLKGLSGFEFLFFGDLGFRVLGLGFWV